MNHLKINVIGYTTKLHTIRKTFFVRDEQEFGDRVEAWAKENGLVGWTRK